MAAAAWSVIAVPLSIFAVLVFSAVRRRVIHIEKVRSLYPRVAFAIVYLLLCYAFTQACLFLLGSFRMEPDSVVGWRALTYVAVAACCSACVCYWIYARRVGRLPVGLAAWLGLLSVVLLCETHAP
jgi:hypothetical protein